MMLLKSALIVTTLGTALGVAIPALAQQDGQINPQKGQPQTGGGEIFGPIPGQNYGRIARTPLPKLAFVRKPSGESDLIVKFADATKARPQADGSLRLTAQAEAPNLNAVIAQYNLTFRSIFGKKTEAELTAVEQKAAMHSGKAQPDLSGFMYVEGNAESLQSAANALNALPEVEHIYFQEPFRPGIMPTQDIGAAAPMAPAAPPVKAAIPAGDDGGIAGTDPDCGACDPDCGDCFTETPGVPFCSNLDCCDLVGDIRPFCEDPLIGGEWDELCVAIAHLFCDPGIGADRCASAINGSCFEAHGTAGCVDETCCNTVCALDTFCCENEWDEACVALANVNCINPGGGVTPDYTPLQGYLRRPSYENQPGGAPPDLAFPAPVFPGFTGEGYWLFDDQYLTDHPGAPVPQRYNGLYGLGRQLLEEYGVGTSALTRGRTIKVGVIEWAYYAGHEDLNVIPEPGQTMITIPDVGFPSHATACLGIINAQINGFGMNGIAPDAQAYFFPLTSVEEGPRQFAAWTSMLNAFGPGDVVSCSYGGGGNLNTNAATWTLIRIASDIGITCCIAAGNDCANLDDANDLGDSGGIVVGAATPGRFFTRLTFSNYYQEGTAANSNIVHVSSWGESVPALAGSASLQLPDGDWNRSYCNNFNGTSAAAPQVAGAVACLQGLAKQFYGIALGPTAIRAALAGTGFPQAGIPNPENLPGFDEAFGCGPDTDPEEGPNKIGPYPRPERAGYFILNQFNVGFDDAPLIDGVIVIRGNLVGGTVFSLKGADNNFFTVNSLHTDRKFRPNLPPPASRVLYLAGGQIADIMVTGHTETITNQIQINTTWTPTTGNTVTYMVTEAYDFFAGKWVLLAFEPASELLLATGVTGALGTAAQRFINTADGNKVYMRQYAVSLGGPTTAYTMRWDLFDLQAFGAGGGGVGAE